jgi:plasmid stabilization system protein ParE
MKILWTRESLNRLMEIEEFIAKDNEERAVQFVDETIAHAEDLLHGDPRIGRMVPEISNPAIRELLFKKYRIVYRVNKSNVEILTVFEGHRLLRIGAEPQDRSGARES